MPAKTSLKPADFVHLHNHTQYSLLDGLTKIPAMVEQIKNFGMSSVAVTDHGTLSGLIEFYKEATKGGVKPLFGMEAYMAARQLTDKDPAKDKNNYHLIILAMNLTGYQNLMRLSTIANLEGFYYKPRIDHDLLKKYNQGLIILSGCIGGEVGDALRLGQYDQAKEIAMWYQQIFGDRYYLEVQDHGHVDHPSSWSEQVEVTNQTFKLAKELGIEIVLTSDAHYLNKADQQAHEVLLCVQTGSFLSDEKRMSLANFELHLTDPKQIIKRWGKDHPDIITNTKIISDRCSIELELGKILIPQFSVPTGETEKTYLEKLVYQGLAWRYGKTANTKTAKMTISQAKKQVAKNILERAEYELGVINSMGFNGYFLIIADFINWGKHEGIVFGPGRGSAAGSIVSYALRITELDPLEYDLLFERFLNPDRISMPDIDIDIQDSRRNEVIQYCVDKYGDDHVANIVTFGRMAARNAVRDVARVLQVPYAEADRWAKLIPPPIQGRHIPLSKSLADSQELKTEYNNTDSAKQVFDLATQLEGTIRSHGVHAAGVVIAPDDIVKFVPLERAQKGVIATQYSMGPIEDLGLLKIDFLGLSNLTIIKNALRIVKKVYARDVDINTINLDDKKTYELLQRGDTTGVFQFESAGMKRYLKELKPTEFDDLVAMGALYRPGPMQWIEDFIARKHGTKKIEYIHPAMEPALKNTYGVIVYQEQVMQISKDLAGFSGGQADTLRKGVAKKIPEVLAKLKDEFIDGAIKTSNANRPQMEKFWKQLEAFAAYAFPKAHAACYALTSYQTAYLKAHYPAAFMASLMTSDYDNTDRLAIEITECKQLGIGVLQPDVNESFIEFAVVPKTKQIRFGLAAVKNVGANAVTEILRARDEGHFDSLEDFFSRVNIRIVNRKAIESLVRAGAFDRFGERSQLIHNLDVILAYANRQQKQASSGQTDLFGQIDDDQSTKPKLALDKPPTVYSQRQQLMWERELLGIYLSQQPLDAFQALLTDKTTPISVIEASHDAKTVTVGGSIVDIREITTKNGQKMAFVRLADQFNEIELVIFPSIYKDTVATWQRDKVIVATGKVTVRDRNGGVSIEPKVLVDQVIEITPEEAADYQPSTKKPKTGLIEPINSSKSTVGTSSAQLAKRLFLRLHRGDDQQMLLSLKTLIDENQGDTEVVLVLGSDDDKQIIRLPARVDVATESIEVFSKLIGAQNVKLST
ncbi:MAG TPA: DNA polymerase III subunit alpha [Candidatus Saccharimonadales bacterium]|nr:DNA polymerase III subunit alpha [Candidatus Saccharimonadales bacterium]